MKIRKMLLFSKAISVSYSFSVSIENHLCNRTKEKTYKLLVYSCNRAIPLLYLLRNFSNVYVLFRPRAVI